MTKEKLQSLSKYVADMEARLASPVPKKWEHAPDAYKAFLKNEIRLHKNKIDSEKLSKVEK